MLFASVGSTLIAVTVFRFVFHEDEDLSVRIKRTVFKLARLVPGVQAKINREVEKSLKDMESSLHLSVPGEVHRRSLPEKGIAKETLMSEVSKLEKMATTDWRKGMVSGALYNCSPELTELTTFVYGKFAWSNPLHTDLFPNIRKMEAEVVQWTVNLFNGGDEACGTMTSGGTESILMAMRAYRQVGYERGIRFPEIVCSVSAHCAFEKAAAYFRMKIRHIPVDPRTRMVDLSAMKNAISANTVVLVGSAPQFPHGIVDPIESIAKLGLRYGVGVHVDCCLGGFVLPFMGKAGFDIEPFDFCLKGVTSISADTHKYGCTPKGTSVVMYSNKNLRHKQFFVTTDWQGGVYVTPTMSGSRPGGLIAATWATMMSMGMDGYVEATKKVVSTTLQIASEVAKIPGIYVLGSPRVNVVALASDEFDIFRVFEAMVKIGWNLNGLQFPSSFHLCITLIHTQEGVAERFVRDIKEATKEVTKTPKAKCTGAGVLYGVSQTIADRSIISDLAEGYVDLLYKAGSPAK